jgi:CHAP domain
VETRQDRSERLGRGHLGQPTQREARDRGYARTRSAPRVSPSEPKPTNRSRARGVHVLVLFVLVLAIVAATVLIVNIVSANRSAGGASGTQPATTVNPNTMRGRIVEIAMSQLGYRTDPPNTYCNKYSAFFVAGSADCGNSNLDEEWCADFAAWVWLKAGALVTYQFINGDINSSAASFYEWGVAHGTWHPVGSGYVPQPGDVAIYGLNTSTLVAAHVAVVIGYKPGDRGPNVVNGDGDTTGFSVVELGVDQYKADVPGSAAYLSGYTSPTPA